RSYGYLIFLSTRRSSDLLKEVYDIYNKTEVYIGGDKLDPLGTNIKKYDEDFVKDFVKDLNLSGVIHGLEEYEFTGSDLNNKYVRSEEHTSELQSRFDLVC